MKRYIALGWCAFLSLMVATECLAAQYTGRVTDANGLPLPFVSVYVKDNPYVGTVTADDGTFTLDIPAEDRAGELVFSFIGFRTVEMPLPGLRTDTPVAVTLEEQPILLDGTEVSAKISRKESRKIKQAVLTRFVERMRHDFPQERTARYHVISWYQGAQDDRQLLRHEMIGTVEEYPKGGTRDNDSIVVVPEQVREHTTDEVELGYDKLNELAAAELAKQAKKQKKGKKSNIPVFEKVDLDEQMLTMHRYLWGGYTGSMADMINVKKPNKWDYTSIGDLNVLTYTEKRNYIGIIKIELQVFFYVNPATLSIEKIAQSLEGELHIPFGYKLTDEQLELVNLLQMQTDTLEKYRAKHVYMDVKRNVFLRLSDGNRVVKEKNLDVKASIADRKGKQLNYNAQAKLLVTGEPEITTPSDSLREAE